MARRNLCKRKIKRNFSNSRFTFRPNNFGVEAMKVCGVILCTSGSALEMSEGLKLSHAQCTKLSRPFPQLNRPTLLSFTSLYWLSGISLLLHSLNNCSKRIITRRSFSPYLLIELIEKFSVQVVVISPMQAHRLLLSPLLKLANFNSLRLLIVVGGYLSPNLRTRLQDHLLNGKLEIAYGMTEISSLVAVK